jgi:hypothetical protein
MTANNNSQEALWHWKPAEASQIVSTTLNNDYFAHERHRELKLVWLKVSAHEDSDENVTTKKYFLACL